ncbi:MAG: helix-turn-helix domain-containing protein [Candidatus Tectomicrobia bacterium]|jgi:hypothetical protein|nr:helix-turn-helix domain-containing protein [Candidatus Tectomicrobia bacterium]
MSIAIMTHVWQRSQHKGSELLLLLAIADNANDQGIAYPSVRTLAKKTRLSRRNVQYLINKVEQSGELRVSVGTGPHGCNEYHILLEWGANFAQGMKSPDEKQRMKGGAKAIAPEPNTEPKREEKTFSLESDHGAPAPEVSLSPIELKRLGLTPGSTVWRALVEDPGE